MQSASHPSHHTHTFLKACHALGLTLSLAPYSPTLASKALWEVNPAHSPPQPQRFPFSICFGPGPCFPHSVCKCWFSLELGPGSSSPNLLCTPPETFNPSPGRQDPSLKSLPCLSDPHPRNRSSQLLDIPPKVPPRPSDSPHLLPPSFFLHPIRHHLHPKHPSLPFIFLHHHLSNLWHHCGSLLPLVP